MQVGVAETSGYAADYASTCASCRLAENKKDKVERLLRICQNLYQLVDKSTNKVATAMLTNGDITDYCHPESGDAASK
jgi:hypothetical protein